MKNIASFPLLAVLASGPSVAAPGCPERNAPRLDSREESETESPEPTTPPSLEPIRLSPDGGRFVLAKSGRAFRLWGVNYDHDNHGEQTRLLEDYWEDEWETVRQDFAEMKDLGANAVRIHLYPKQGEVERALAAMDAYRIGKPLVIEETFPLTCSLEEMETFLRQSKPLTAGYFSFYWGRTIEQYDSSSEKTITDALVGGWLKFFRAQADAMKQP